MGLTDKTVSFYLDILTGTFMVRQLQPWHENIGKRQVKSLQSDPCFCPRWWATLFQVVIGQVSTAVLGLFK